MEKENKELGKDIGFERIRRVTGYLAGDVKRFNNAKKAEEKDRVKHTQEKDFFEAVSSATCATKATSPIFKHLAMLQLAYNLLQSATFYYFF